MPYKIHSLKILPVYFNAILEEGKTFELRKNDRDFQVGDLVLLKEWNGEDYTGRYFIVEITYILAGKPLYGLASEYCIFSFRVLSVYSRQAFTPGH